MTDTDTDIFQPESSDLGIGGIVLGLVFFLAALALCVYVLWTPINRGADMHYKSWFMVTHWGDEIAFPPQSQFCKEPYCLRTDTQEKWITGRKGYTSEVTYFLCPDHEPRGWSRWNDRLGGFLWFVYHVLVGVLGLLLPVLVFGLGAAPLLWLFGKVSEGLAGVLGVVCMILGVILFIWSLGAVVMYMWW